MGHKSLKALRIYERTATEQHQMVSNILSSDKENYQVACTVSQVSTSSPAISPVVTTAVILEFGLSSLFQAATICGVTFLVNPIPM